MFDICLLISFCINTIYIWYLSHLEANDQLLHLKRFSVLVPEYMYVISLIMQRLNGYFEWSWPIYLLRVSFVCKIFFALKRTFILQIWLILFRRFKFQFIESFLPRRHPKSWNIWIEWRTSSIPPAWFATKFLCFPWFYE